MIEGYQGYRTIKNRRFACGLAMSLCLSVAASACPMTNGCLLKPVEPTEAAAQPEKKPPAQPEPAPPTPPAPPAATPPAGQPTPAPQPPAKDQPADPAVEDLIKDMQKPAPAPKTVTPAAKPGVGEQTRPSTAGAKASQPGKARLLREGTFIVSRRGRVVRTAAGEWQFAFDTGTKNAPTHEPAMVLMPCEKLMALEKVAEKHGEDVTFTMSGQVFVYNGRNYLLPTNYVINRQTGDVKTMQ